MIFLSSRLFSKIPNFRSRYYYFFHYPPLPSSFYSRRWPSGKLDDTASFKDRMFEGICFIRAHSSVFRWNSICSQLGKFSAIPPLYFFPPRWFCFRGGFFWFWFSRLFLSFSFFFICALLRRIMNYNCWRVKHRAKENIWNNKWGTLRRCPSVVKCIVGLNNE